jgi:hypothetical protein
MTVHSYHMAIPLYASSFCIVWDWFVHEFVCDNLKEM